MNPNRCGTLSQNAPGDHIQSTNSHPPQSKPSPTAPPKAKPACCAVKAFELAKQSVKALDFAAIIIINQHVARNTLRDRKSEREGWLEKKREWGECEQKIEKQRRPEEKVCRLFSFSNGIRKGQVFAAVARGPQRQIRSTGSRRAISLRIWFCHELN